MLALAARLQGTPDDVAALVECGELRLAEYRGHRYYLRAFRQDA